MNTPAIQKVLDSGNWMVRRSDNGISYGGFMWEPIGKWTEAPDWHPHPGCGNGLHGNAPHLTGDRNTSWTSGRSVDFCEIDPTDMILLGDKIKVRRARILMRNQLPEGLVFEGDMYLTKTDIKKLPKNLEVRGNLTLTAAYNITKLPAGLKVIHSLNIDSTMITTLPKDLEVGEKFNGEGSCLRKIPNGVRIGGAIYLRRSKIEKLPDGMQVNGDLNLSITKIEKLPDGMQVHGDLGLSYTPIKKLPDTLIVRRGINLRRSLIQELPENLLVPSFLYLTGTPIKKLPAGLKVGWNLDLSETTVITELPEGLEVGGELDISKSRINKLPKGLKVGDLNVRRTLITALPEDLLVKRYVFLPESPCSIEIPVGVKRKVFYE